MPCERAWPSTPADAELGVWAFDALMTDGRAVHIRPIEPSDTAGLIAFHRGLSAETVYRRFFGVHPKLREEEAEHFTEVDHRDRMAFVATVSDELVGVGRYDRPSGSASAPETAFVIADAFQHNGVGTLLFETLAAYARGLGITRFAAEVLVGNEEMLGVFSSTGLVTRSHYESGTVLVEMDLAWSPEYLAHRDEREATAEAASLEALLRPRSVAAVGDAALAGGIVHVPDVASLEDAVDLVLVSVPAPEVLGVVTAAAQRGIRAAAILSSGLGRGDDGARPTAELLGVARSHGMRVIGPGSLGLVNTDPAARLDATTAELDLRPGRLALVTQSASVGGVVASPALLAAGGLSCVVSLGDSLDVSVNDLLCFLERDERTSVVALVAESFGNLRKFARIARRVGLRRPVVAVTAGPENQPWPVTYPAPGTGASHEVFVRALLDRSGVVEVEDLEHLADTCGLLLTGRLPAGRRVALVGNAPGPLLECATACAAHDLEVPALSRQLQQELGPIARPAGAARPAGPTRLVGPASNPIQLAAGATTSDLERAVGLVVSGGAIDAVIVVVTDTATLPVLEVPSVLQRLAGTTELPLLACLLGGGGTEGPRGSELAAGEAPWARCSRPEGAAAALGRVARYASWRRRNESATSPEAGTVQVVSIDEQAVAALSACQRGTWLGGDQAAGLLEACGIHIAGLEPGGAAAVEVSVGAVTDPAYGSLVTVALSGAPESPSGRSCIVPPLEPGEAAALVGSLRSGVSRPPATDLPEAGEEDLVRLVELVASLADQARELAEIHLDPVVVGAEGAFPTGCRVRVAADGGPSGPDLLFRSLAGSGASPARSPSHPGPED